MSELRQCAEATMEARLGHMPSGLVFGWNERQQLTEVVWQPTSDHVGNQYQVTRSNYRFAGLAQHGNSLARSGPRIRAEFVHSVQSQQRTAQGEPISSYPLLGSVSLLGEIRHLATLATGGKSLLEELSGDGYLGRRSSVLQPSEQTHQLGRYACCVVNYSLLAPLNESPDFKVQFLARPANQPLNGLENLIAIPIRYSREEMKVLDKLEAGVGHCIDEYADKPKLVPVRLYDSPHATAQYYKELLGPTIDGAVKEFGPGAHQRVVLFSEV